MPDLTGFKVFPLRCFYSLGLLMMLVGCGSTPYTAPIKDGGKSHDKAVKSPPAAPSGYYRVLPGDTLYKIAFEKGLDFQEVATWNRLADPARIEAGALLRLTAPPSKPATPAEPTLLASAPLPHAETPPSSWEWPSRGVLIGKFGENMSKGIDLAGRSGQPVQAAAAGQVAYTGNGLRGYGKLIIIRHGKTLLSAYAHQSRILVKEGQHVAQGQVIGEMGDSDADRVKLHFEIREQGKPVDPLGFLPRSGPAR